MQQHEPESKKTLSVHTEDTQHRIIKSVELATRYMRSVAHQAIRNLIENRADDTAVGRISRGQGSRIHSSRPSGLEKVSSLVLDLMV